MSKKFNPKKMLFVHVHWMKYYDGRNGDKPFSGGASRDGWMENYNFLNYGGRVFGGFWPGRHSKGDTTPNCINLARLGFVGGLSADGVTVLYFAPHPDDKHLRLVGWYENSTVYRSLQVHPDDGQEYNVTTLYSDAHRIYHAHRTHVFTFTGWWKQGAYRFGDSAPADVIEQIWKVMNF